MARLQSRLLEEMVFERLLAAIDPETIVALGRDLDRSLERAVETVDGAAADPADVKLALLRRALARLGETICDLATAQLPFL